MKGDLIGIIGDFKSILDVGAGIRPMYPGDSRSVCIEPFDKYAEILETDYMCEVVRGTALNSLDGMSADVVLLLDVIEHMEKKEGMAVIELAKKSAKKRVVVFTPDGFMEQHGDAWGLGGDIWQEHRSGWTGADFYGFHVTKNFHWAGFILAVYDK